MVLAVSGPFIYGFGRLKEGNKIAECVPFLIKTDEFPPFAFTHGSLNHSFLHKMTIAYFRCFRCTACTIFNDPMCTKFNGSITLLT